MSKLLSLFILALLTIQASAQVLTVKGKVQDAGDGSYIPGVSITVKGTQTGTISDLNGTYTLEAKKGETLIFSFVGMETIEREVTGSTLNVSLKSALSTMDELVVVGYGVQKKSVVTGAIATVKAEDITRSPVSSPAQALQGRTAGVTVTNNSGQPGAGISIQVRGVGTNGNTAPMYVVDGIQVSDISFISAEDIASMEVLKDAASSAIYGSRGANGVVLISTKRGKSGKMNVSYDGYYGVQNAWKKASVLNAREYMMLHNEGQLNDGFAPVYSQGDISGNTVDTDWQDQIFGTAPITNHSIQISGGTEKSTYLSSFSYFKQDGIVGGEKSAFERFTLRLNADYKFSDKVKAGNNVTLVRKQSSSINENNEFGSILQEAILHDPLTPVYVTDAAKIADYQAMAIQPTKNNGMYYGISDKSLREIVNPLASIANTYGEGTTNQIIGNVYIEAEPIANLKFKSDIGVDLGTNIGRGYSPAVYYNVVNVITNTSANQSATSWTNWQWENTVNYSRTIGRHKLNGLLGMTAKKDIGTGFGGSRSALSIPGWDYAWLNNGANDESQKSYGYPWEHSLLSYFGRLNYTFQDKYMLSGVLRYDGSSRFGSNNKFGWFKSVQGGWVVSQEDFLKNNDAISFLKLRLGYGETGSEDIGDFGYIETFSTTYSYPLGTDKTPISGSAINSSSNPDIKWESSKESNLGIDANFLNNRITLTVDLYDRTRDNLLSYRPIPDYTGVGAPVYNLGSVSNKGIEAILGYNKKTGDFNYDVSANFAYNKNEVTAINNTDKYINGPGAFQLDGILRMEEGMPLPFFYGYKTNGIFQNAAEVASYKNSTGKVIQPNAKPGDIRFIDLNGDGAITPDDRQNLGSPHPDFTFGFTANMSYKNFDFSMFWQGQTGNKLINVVERLELTSDQNYLSRYLDRWTGEGSTNDFPRFSHTDPNGNFSKLNDMVHIEDGSYIRLKNLQIGYTLPATLVKTIGISKARFYVTGQNLLTFTNYTGMDPEIGHGGSFSGFDRGSYPQARTFLLGTNITF